MPAKESKHTPITFNSKPAPTEPSKPLTAHEKALQVHHLAQAFSVWPELTCSSPLTSLPVRVTIFVLRIGGPLNTMTTGWNALPDVLWGSAAAEHSCGIMSGCMCQVHRETLTPIAH